MTDLPRDIRPAIRPGGLSILAWTLAWGLTGIALYVSGVFNSPRTGPLWVALVGGAIPWAFAGALTFRSAAPESSNRLNPAVLLIWALAYLVAFGLAAFASTALGIALGGFFFVVFGWSIGAAVGALASAWLLAGRSRAGRVILIAAIWMLGFFVGGFVALMGLYLGPELGKITIGSLIGQPAALTLGAGLGCAVGGLVASAIAVPLTRLVARKW
jgi:hypothetical protein